jgi:uncharacterized membrane protein YccC
VRQPRTALADLNDRFSASDPGLIRLLNALTTVGAILLTLLILSLLHTTVSLLVVGAMGALVASFAISDKHPRDQAVTLALGLPLALAVVTLGAELYAFRAAADAVFVVLIFVAVYIRRFGPRGTGLGLVSFQIFFVSQFAHVDPALLPTTCFVLAIGFCSSALVRFGLVRATPARTLGRLRHSFRARLAACLDAMADLAAAPPGSPTADSAEAALHRCTVRLHQCALMIQSRLEDSAEDDTAASRLERRVAEAEIAAERLGRLLVRALDREPDLAPGLDTTHTLRDLRTLRRLTTQVAPGPRGADSDAARDRLLGYFDDSSIPAGSPPELQEVYRAIAETARSLLGLRISMNPDAEPDVDEGPRTAQSREELETEELCLRGNAEETAPSGSPTGLDRITTRLACQVAAGSALAIIGGELLSTQRWYWAVLTCWVVFINTSSTGEILVKGYRRLAGTLIGVLAGAALADLVGGDPWISFTLVILCVFGMFFTAPLSYTLMSFFVTTMIGLLYTLLGTFSTGVLVLRIKETALGAACGLVTAALVLPVRTSRQTDAKLADVLDELRATLSLTLPQLAGERSADLLHSARQLDTALDALHIAAKPLAHQVNPLRARRRRANFVMALLDSCAYHARSLAAIAEMVPGHPRIVPEPRLTAVWRRLDHNVSTLAEFVRSGGRQAGDLKTEPSIAALLQDPGSTEAGSPEPTDTAAASSLVTARVMRHLQRLDEAVLGLAQPLGAPSPGPDADDARPEDEPGRVATVGG